MLGGRRGTLTDFTILAKRFPPFPPHRTPSDSFRSLHTCRCRSFCLTIQQILPAMEFNEEKHARRVEMRQSGAENRRLMGSGTAPLAELWMGLALPVPTPASGQVMILFLGHVQGGHTPHGNVFHTSEAYTPSLKPSPSLFL